MTDGPFLSGPGQMETNSHLLGWDGRSPQPSVRDAPIPLQPAILYTRLETLKSWRPGLDNSVKPSFLKLVFYHNPAFTLGLTPPLQPNCDKSAACVEIGRNSQFLRVNLQTAHFALSSPAQHVHTSTLAHTAQHVYTATLPNMSTLANKYSSVRMQPHILTAY